MINKELREKLAWSNFGLGVSIIGVPLSFIVSNLIYQFSKLTYVSSVSDIVFGLLNPSFNFIYPPYWVSFMFSLGICGFVVYREHIISLIQKEKNKNG